MTAITKWTPSIIPNADDHDVYLVVDDFGRNEVRKMSDIPDARSIADDLAETGAGYVLIAPADCRDDVVDSLAQGFRDACEEHGISINAEDVTYYVTVVMAKVREMMPRMVETDLKARQ